MKHSNLPVNGVVVADVLGVDVAVVVPVVAYLWFNALIDTCPPHSELITDLHTETAIKKVSFSVIDVFSAYLYFVFYTKTPLVNLSVAIIVDVVAQFH